MTQEDMISRQAAIDALDKGAWGVEWDKALAKAMLENLPSATVKKTGKWISTKVRGLFSYNSFKCSVCGNILNFDGVNAGRGNANFCPNCGAKMEVE
jgi:DNA-directed RNA polymerase subunit RPC12/RpoP